MLPIAKQRLTQIAGARGRRGRITLTAVISWTFLFRVHSECLPLTKQRAGEDLLSEGRLKRKAAIGLAGRELS